MRKLLQTPISCQSELLHCVQYRLPKLLSAESGAVRCVVLDSVAAPFRAADKMPWPDRQAKLHSLAYGLRQIALQYNVTVLALNQVAILHKQTFLCVWSIPSKLITKYKFYYHKQL